MDSNSNQQRLKKRRRGKLSGIDGLKAIAIIGVTLFHMLPQDVPGGYMGVSLFFVITGYLLAFSDSNRLRQHAYSVTQYVWHRIRRIYPPLLIMLLVTVGVNGLLLPNSLNGIRPELMSIVFGYNNFWQIAQDADYFTRLINVSPFTHLWFMGIEMQYFIIWPILFGIFIWLCRRLSYRVAMAVLAFVALGSSLLMTIQYHPGDDVTRLYYGTDTRIYALLFGAFLGIRRATRTQGAEWSRARQAINSIVFLVLLAGVIACYALLDGKNPIVYQYMMLAATFGFGLLILLCEYDRLAVTRFLNWPAVAWLGKRSYGIFLWQYPVLYLFQQCKVAEYVGNPFVYNGCIIALIIALTVWSDSVVGKLSQGFTFRSFCSWLRGVSMRLVTAVACVVMCFGVVAVFSASDEKAADMSELQARLEANAEEQQAENEKARQLTAEEQSEVEASLTGVSAIGDSVMLGASPAMRKVLPGVYIDAKVSRYVGAGLDIARGLAEQNRLGHVVVIGLGTNGPIMGYYEHETKDLVNYLGPDRMIFWVNVYGPKLEWEKPNNEYLEQLAKERDNIVIVNWHDLAAKHPEWLSEDGIHPNDEGIKEYAKLLHDTMEKTLAEKKLNADLQ
ncbi:acyltransferase family protein [Veillonella magna]|uniref:acyltransferase family protein n=1 Tax=Veillonella magna TaxID=464322 RepID=UPI0023EF96C0|nr:acyltransferase family protein [Veillonella magna]MBD8976607.1 acetyltransferase [Veillonella magna]